MRSLVACGGVLLAGFGLRAQEAQPEKSVDPPALIGPASQVSPLPPLTMGKRVKIYAWEACGPQTFAGVALSAAFDQWRNEPPEWRQGGEGFGRRYGSWFGRNAIKETIQFGVAAVDGEDTRYRPSRRKDLLGRSYDAAVQTMFPYTTRGGRTLAVSRLAGAFGSGFISDAWYPDSRTNPGDAAARGATLLSGDVLNNLLYEFWPDIKKKVLHR